jgi:peptidoglycan/LPS O-acetylase OafA/YrhL
VATTAGMLALLPSHLAGGAGHWLFAALVALQVWTSIFACVGLALRWRHAGHPIIRYLADASYWVYLCHLPLVGFLQLAVLKMELHAAVKFTLVAAITTAVALLSYHALGRRKRRSGDANVGQDSDPVQQVGQDRNPILRGERGVVDRPILVEARQVER